LLSGGISLNLGLSSLSVELKVERSGSGVKVLQYRFFEVGSLFFFTFLSFLLHR